MGCSSSSISAASSPPKNQIASGNYASVTKITIKPELAATAAALLASKVKTFMSWEGVVAVHNVVVSDNEMWFVGVYEDAAALEANAPNVKAVMGEFGPMMGAAPDRVTGKVHSVATGPLAGPVAPGHAAAVTKIAIQPGKFAEAEAVLQAKLPEFATWAGIVSFVAVQVSDELLATVAVYQDQASMLANADNVKAALGSLGPLLAGPPAREAGVVALNGDGPDLSAVKKLVDTFQSGYFTGASVDVATAECTFNPPGAPPMPIAAMCGMLAGVKQAFPDWTSVCHGVSLNADGTYEVLTQQCIGAMKGDLPAMGPFPAVKLADVPKAMRQDVRLPVEVGTWTLSADGFKIASGTYAGATKDVKGAKVTPSVAAMWNKKGDLSDVGFGCLFSLMGVTLPPPPSAAEKTAPALMDVLMTCQVADFGAWYPCFNEHAHSTTFHYEGVAHSVSMPRSAAVDVSKEEVFQDIRDPNAILVPFVGADMPTLGALMSEPAFVEGIKDAVVSQEPPLLMGEMPAPAGAEAAAKEAAPPPAAGKVDMFFSYEVADADKWIEGFLAHGSSKTGTWGVEAAMTRADFCDEAKTRVFKSAANPNKVGGLCFGVDLAKMGEFMAHPSFATIAQTLAIQPETMFMKLLSPMPPPPPAAEPPAAMPEAVAFFFNGEPMAPKAEKMMGECYAESHVLSFIGPYAPPVPPLDKEHLQGAMGNLVASFPDLTFNFTNVAPSKTADGGWAADIVVMGTHTGAAFSPMPGKLPAIATTGKQVKIGPETFTLYAEEASGKVLKTTIEPLHAGAPAGPPGFYTEIGGVLPAPPPELPPSPTKAVPAASAA